MMESKSVHEIGSRLSNIERLQLIRTLNALPSAQFDELVFALEAPKKNIPRNPAEQRSRISALLEWAESPMGPGLLELGALLDEIVANKSNTAQQFLSFAISGQLGNVTTAEIEAIVRLLRKKTGDETIDVAFSKKGSIKIILSGSSQGLEKLKELYELGELENLEIPPVEAVHDVTSSTDIEKARLVQTLRLESTDLIILMQNLGRLHQSAVNLADSLGSIGINELRIKNAVNLASDLAKDLEQAQGLVDNPRARISSITQARARAYQLDFAIARIRGKYHINLDYELVHARYHAQALANSLIRRIDIAEADLSYTKLRDINLRQANLAKVNFSGADLAGSDLSEANLTKANLTRANVQGTIFGGNLGLTRLDENILRQRGATVLVPPSLNASTIDSALVSTTHTQKFSTLIPHWKI